MNDRFKYRIYDKGNEQYLDPEDMDCVCHLPNGCFTIATWDGIQGDMKYWADEDIVVEMSTGLKDKNGNLIYEGDYIKDWRGDVYKVVWLDEYAQFFCENINDATDGYHFDESIHDMCICGNIHEQAEQKD